MMMMAKKENITSLELSVTYIQIFESVLSYKP